MRNGGMNQNRKSKLFEFSDSYLEIISVSEPNSISKTNPHAFNEQKYGDSRDIIGFEDSLISGTKIDIPVQKKNKKQLNDKRHKIEEIQKKYQKPKKKEPHNRITKGFSYQDSDNNKFVGTAKGNKYKKGKKEVASDIEVGIKASKIITHKRDFRTKKGSEMITDKTGYKARKNIEEEAIDEKMNTQTFRFTNQFKSDFDGDADFLVDEEDAHCGEEIAEEIESRSNDSPRYHNGKNMKLRKNTGPVDIPSDSNPFSKKKSRQEELNESLGTPLNRPPKVPNKNNSKLGLISPAHQIFTTKRQKKQQENEERGKNTAIND